MTIPRLLDPDKQFMLRCVCGSTIFTCIIDGTGVLCNCQKCFKGYKLESPAGMKIADA